MSLYPLELKGSPKEMGLKRGSVFRDLIRYRRVKWMEFIGGAKPMAWRMVQDILEPIEERLPSLVEEMKGVAEGSGESYQDIALMNCYTEIVF